MSCAYCIILDGMFVMSTLPRRQLESVNMREKEKPILQDDKPLDAKYNELIKRGAVLMMHEIGPEKDKTKTNGIQGRLILKLKV